MYKFFAAALALLPLISTAYSISNIYSSYMDAYARQPEQAEKMQGPAQIAAIMIELMALLCFVVAYLILTNA
mgnify:CR=1 FL=1